jgi:hypothetical protein
MISTNPPGLAGLGKSTKYRVGRSTSDDEVPFIVILDVGEGGSRAERGGLDACDIYMLAAAPPLRQKDGHPI